MMRLVSIASMPPFRLRGDPRLHIRDRLCWPLIWQGPEYAFRLGVQFNTKRTKYFHNGAELGMSLWTKGLIKVFA
ncbi:hypothetical protein XH79_41730 [Bradyrhizobium sp. CCBAU 45389]|nr:hypothetical protein [Bradyrhizobium sp. CCBAU 45389]